MRFSVPLAIPAVCLWLLPVCAAQRLDLAPFAHPCCSADVYRLQTTFDYNQPSEISQASNGSWIYGLQWSEERDIAEVRVNPRTPFKGTQIEVQYWFRNWPYDPPTMPAIEDPVDDPWQGTWISAKTNVSCDASVCRLSFLPLMQEENTRAPNLPGVRYRRTLKLRLVFRGGHRPDIASVQVYSESTLRRIQLRVELGVGTGKSTPAQPRFTAYNGQISEVVRDGRGVLVTVDTAEPRPSGSNDVTIIQIKNGKEAFSFIPSDVEKGPMYVPDFHAYITLASDSKPFSKSIVRNGARIRERLAVEPEQTYERASREIPPLDPVERQGGRLYLVLAADASWQKFAFEWGGNVTISKHDTKAKGRELRRLTWAGDRVSWRIGTGKTPSFRPASGESNLTTFEDYLPVGVARWAADGFEYEEDAFATLLSGPLSPEDPARSEQTPAVLLLRILAKNTTAQSRTADLWFGMLPGESLDFNNGLLTANRGQSVRAYLRLSGGASVERGTCRDGQTEIQALHISTDVAASSEAPTYIAIPFIPELTSSERSELVQLDFAAERRRVVAYWRSVTDKAVPFRVPEARFNSFARGLVARIRISATKDPNSGRYMVPAASYRYDVYENEASFQCQLLDVLGLSKLSVAYLRTMVELQGSKPFDGTFTEQKAVYHGVRTNDEYDYTASQYNLDHGTVLWTLAEHYFYTRDRAWVQSVILSMRRAADWIIEQRKLTKVIVHGVRCPEYGLLPAGNLEDNSDWGHWFSVNAYASLGLSALADVLADVKDPAAAKYHKEAAAYRSDLRAAINRAVAASPVIRLRDNTYVPYVPARAHQRIRLFGPLRTDYYARYPEKVRPTYRLSATREVLYGPMILLDTGIFGVDESLARWVLDDWEDNATMSEPLGLTVHGWVDEDYWFSRGGMVFQANLQNPIRTYLRRGEPQAAIRTLFNDFVACYYPSVNIFTEEYRQWGGPSGPFYKVPDEAKFVHRLRDSLVTEYNDDLLLAAGTPGYWLAPGREISVTEAPTHYGPVTYMLRGSLTEVEGTIALPHRNKYRNAYLDVRLPQGKSIADVFIDEKRWVEVNKTTGRIHLPRSGQPLRLLMKTVDLWGKQ